MGQMPSRLGYQPTLGTELAQLQERIANTAAGAITSIQAVYVPADDFTDPAAAPWVDANAHWLHTALPIAGALFVVALGMWLAKRIQATMEAEAPAIDLAEGERHDRRE